jgi:hypothetical protein
MFVEFELVRSLAYKLKDLSACENWRVYYTAFLIDSNDVAFSVRNRPVAASVFFDVHFLDDNFRRSILDWFSFTHNGDLRGSTESIP